MMVRWKCSYCCSDDGDPPCITYVPNDVVPDTCICMKVDAPWEVDDNDG